MPVVGKEEVRRSRDMHWLRIDRYYSSTDSFINDAKLLDQAEGLETIGVLHRLEQASGNPQVNFQPVMCQHCNNAPCETVCPVAATSHGAQGQNQMVYNRCVCTDTTNAVAKPASVSDTSSNRCQFLAVPTQPKLISA